MNLKNISILTAVLAVIAGVLWIAQLTKSQPIQSDLVGQSLLEPDSISEASVIQVFEDLSESPAVEVIKSNENWIVPARYGLPADFSKISDLVNGLSESKIIRAVTDDPDRIKTLDIGQSRVVFQDSEGSTLANISFGKSGNTQGHFTQVDRSPKVVLVEEKPFIQTDPEDWTVDTAWEFEWSAVRTISGEGLSYEKADADAGFSLASDASKEIDQEALESKLSPFSSMRFQDLAAIESDAVKEAMVYARTVSITLESGDDFTFKYGRRPEVKPAETTDGQSEENVAEPGTDSEEAEDIPADTAYLTVQSSAATPLWKEIFEKHAFEITSFNFEQLPESLSDFAVDGKPEIEE
ncbi:MAG: DUF4340 domain-containing protein [Verrucomicrobiota bacterium]